MPDLPEQQKKKTRFCFLFQGNAVSSIWEASELLGAQRESRNENVYGCIAKR